MVVAVVLMMVMEVAFVDAVDVIAVRDGLVMMAVMFVVGMPNAARVRTPTVMRARACMVGRAAVRILGAHRESMLLDEIAQLMFQPTFAYVVDVSLMSNGRMTAARAMSMRRGGRALRSIVHVLISSGAV
jgi:hypothetical protein